MNDIISNKIPIATLGHGSQDQDLCEIRKKKPQDLGCIPIFDQRFRVSGQREVTERADFPELGKMMKSQVSCLSSSRFICGWMRLPGISFFFLFFIFKLYNIVLVLPNIEMNPPQVYM